MKNLILIIVAVLLGAILMPLGFLFAMFRPNRSKYFRNVAESIDQLGNAVCGKLFSQWMMKADGYKFGNIDETVSSVLGKNKRKGTLTASGRFLDRILNGFDKNHSIDAIEEDP